MALGTFIAGAYTGAYDSVALGMTEDGYELSWETKAERIEKSDVYGQKLIDFVYQGTDFALQADFMEYQASTVAAGYLYGAALGTEGVIGRLGSNVAEALVLTAVAGTTAAATPATLTANLAIVQPGTGSNVRFTSRLRTVPVRFTLLPYSSTGIKSFVLA